MKLKQLAMTGLVLLLGCLTVAADQTGTRSLTPLQASCVPMRISIRVFRPSLGENWGNRPQEHSPRKDDRVDRQSRQRHLSNDNRTARSCPPSL